MADKDTATDCSTGYYLDNVPLSFIDSIVKVSAGAHGPELAWVDSSSALRAGKFIKLQDEILRKHQPEPRNNEFSPAVVTHVDACCCRQLDRKGAGD